MKTKLLMTVILLSTIVSLAQSQTSKHLLFKGVPIEGTLDKFVSKIKQNGFTEVGSEGGFSSLKGDFASYKGCNVVITTLQGNDLVGKVTVNFPGQNTWSSLASNYFNLKEMLTEKYGKPTESIEKFTSGNSEDDGFKYTQVRMDRCRYVTTYEIDRGSIQLSIKGNASSSFVILTYSDKIDTSKIRAKALEDL